MSAGDSNEPNLTPFIDLFSVLICFLLMTAAWIQLESLQVQIEKKTPLTNAADPSQPPPEAETKKKVKLSLHLYGNKILAREDELEKVLPINGLNIESAEFEVLLGDWRTRFGVKQMLVLHSAEHSTYGQMIHLYDYIIRSGWPDVGINPN